MPRQKKVMRPMTPGLLQKDTTASSVMKLKLEDSIEETEENMHANGELKNSDVDEVQMEAEDSIDGEEDKQDEDLEEEEEEEEEEDGDGDRNINEEVDDSSQGESVESSVSEPEEDLPKASRARKGKVAEGQNPRGKLKTVNNKENTVPDKKGKLAKERKAKPQKNKRKAETDPASSKGSKSKSSGKANPKQPVKKAVAKKDERKQAVEGIAPLKTSQIVLSALRENEDRRGMSIDGLKKYLAANYPDKEWSREKHRVRNALIKGIDDGIIVRPKKSEEAVGLVGRFKIRDGKAASKVIGGKKESLNKVPKVKEVGEGFKKVLVPKGKVEAKEKVTNRALKKPKKKTETKAGSKKEGKGATKRRKSAVKETTSKKQTNKKRKSVTKTSKKSNLNGTF